ncbi:Toll/interleukin-1 receptor homology (TIR) domain superfamily [Arabidopsis suecica]|uniref:ADP-ribosyl cyclase/cyclic ADP-ribose hydrolase n=1 Tax=Arabidopsis suecica TaxID=45249 RepID=A0A8T1YQD6_ARASU|nr:Toll/interleukin-1 receptor homology (TIR) domain superfamily [Arabidopsis suecica]
MASSRTWGYSVFPSFHGQDIRKTFLSHLRKQFNSNGITMFDDQGIERSQTIAPALVRAIRESRISVVVLSKNYASSSWCLNELVEILKCKNIVMPIFYEVDPSDVRKQTGDFGRAFEKSCASKTEERRRWIQALIDVGNIAGEHSLNWKNEADMIEKIAKDISDKLNATPSKDFDGLVGLEFHIRELSSLLYLGCDQVRMVGICGPAGIGKTTIARALQSLLSSNFQLSCFMENVRGCLNIGLDEYGLKLDLQERLLSKILNQKGMRIHHLGAIRDRLHDKKVLIIVDDVNGLEELYALANQTTWFGPGSRVIVTTEDKEILQTHGINNVYHVDFPSREEALEIFCRCAFRQSSPPGGLLKLAERVTELCGNLPLGLRVIGSSLRGKTEDEWEILMRRLEISLDQNIEAVLRVGYDSLHENEQALFLCIAVFFNYKDPHLVMAMLLDSNLDVKQAIQRQEPWKRHILINADEICDVLQNDTGTRIVSGISFDISRVGELSLSERAFKRMCNLQFLSVFKTGYDGKGRVHIPENMEFPPRLRLLQWKAYPRKSLSPKFNLEYLVELDMEGSLLEKLWEGTQPLGNLKKMSLSSSWYLKKLPDLSNATNLEGLDLRDCKNLVELPSSFSYLHKLKYLDMMGCRELKEFPPHINLRSLELVNMYGCSRLRSFPDISTNISSLDISYTAVEELPESIRLWSRLRTLQIYKSRNLKIVTHVPINLTYLDLSATGIEKIPDDIKAVHGLQSLFLGGCRKLASLPELPGSLTYLSANDCESLESVSCPFITPYVELIFTNCFKLNQEARRGIIQQSFSHGWASLPGRELPTDIDHRSTGNSITICMEGKTPFSAFFGFKVFLVISPNNDTEETCNSTLFCRRIGKTGCPIDETPVYIIPKPRAEHIVMFHSDLHNKDKCLEVGNEILFEFNNISDTYEIIECGVRFYTDEAGGSSDRRNEYELDQVSKDDNDWSYEFGPVEASECSENNGHTDRLICDSKEDKIEGNKHTDCWSWLILCFDVSHIVRSIGSFVWGGR